MQWPQIMYSNHIENYNETPEITGPQDAGYGSEENYTDLEFQRNNRF